MKKICIKCKTEYKSRCHKQYDSKYCSMKCYSNKKALNCLNCNTLFKVHGYRRKAKFCSVKCKSKFARISVECSYCKKTYEKHKNYLTKRNFCSRLCKAKGFKGKNAPSWKGGLYTQNQLMRSKFHKEFQALVFIRDNFTCQICNSKQKLQVDHIKSWAKYPELRFDINNCRTLCQKCHYFITFKRVMPKNIKTWGHNYLKGEL